jgi:hypothetical protein
MALRAGISLLDAAIHQDQGLFVETKQPRSFPTPPGGHVQTACAPRPLPAPPLFVIVGHTLLLLCCASCTNEKDTRRWSASGHDATTSAMDGYTSTTNHTKKQPVKWNYLDRNYRRQDLSRVLKVGLPQKRVLDLFGQPLRAFPPINGTNLWWFEIAPDILPVSDGARTSAASQSPSRMLKSRDGFPILERPDALKLQRTECRSLC